MRNGDRESGVTYLGPRSFVIGFAAFLGGFLVLLYGVDKMTETSEPRSPLPPLPPLPPSVSRLATLPAAPATVVATASPATVVVTASPQAVVVTATAAPRAAAASKTTYVAIAPAPKTPAVPNLVAASMATAASKAAVTATETAAVTAMATALRTGSSTTALLAAMKPRVWPHSAPRALAGEGFALPSHTGGSVSLFGRPVAKSRASTLLAAQAAPCHSRTAPAAALPPRVHAATLAPVAHSTATRVHVAAVPKRVAALPVHFSARSAQYRHPMHPLFVPQTSPVLDANAVLGPRAAANAVLGPRAAANGELVIAPAAATVPPAAGTGMRFRYLR